MFFNKFTSPFILAFIAMLRRASVSRLRKSLRRSALHLQKIYDLDGVTFGIDRNNPQVEILSLVGPSTASFRYREDLIIRTFSDNYDFFAYGEGGLGLKVIHVHSTKGLAVLEGDARLSRQNICRPASVVMLSDLSAHAARRLISCKVPIDLVVVPTPEMAQQVQLLC